MGNMAKDKQHSLVLRGRVRDVGFRSRIISAAKVYSLRLSTINDINGSVNLEIHAQDKDYL